MARRGKGVGQGDGWGGPAKGSGNGNASAPKFSVGNTIAAKPHDMSNFEKSKLLKDHLFSLAQAAERQETQVRAAEAWLNRHEGLPVARNLNVNANDLSILDDAALDARNEALERAIAQSSGREVPTQH